MNKHTIDIPDLPAGWVPVAYRCPKNGESFFSSVGVEVAKFDYGRHAYVIVEPEWQWPDWLTAPWIAMDESGEWWAFQREPNVQFGANWSIYGRCLTCWVLAFTPPPCTDWRESKRKNPRLA